MELVLIAVHDSDSQHELLSIVVIENTVQIVSKTLQGKQEVVIRGEPLPFHSVLNTEMCIQPTCVDLLCNLLHCQLAISHVLAVELDTQQPR